jgi:endonuclease/exonuclease/phosphatase family metal-dependent hydrolase
LKVVSYNILNGGGRRLGEIAGVIRSQQPDVVALQEATSRRKAGSLARELCMELVFGKANGKFHVAWLCRMPVRRSENHRVPGLAKTMLEIELSWDGQPLRLFTTHLAGGAETIHPSQEMPIILDRLQRLGGEPHLLAGDLNALHPGDAVGPLPPGLEPMGDAIDDDPRQAIRDILAAGYIDTFRALHPESPGYTYPAERPWLRLDYIFASPGLAERLEASGIVHDDDVRRASDHLPIWASFR